MNKIKLFAVVMTISTGVYAQTAPVIVAQPSTTPYTVYTPSGSYIVVPNYSTGQPSAVIQVSNGSTATVNSGAKK
jgi:hypothetical protein